MENFLLAEQAGKQSTEMLPARLPPPLPAYDKTGASFHRDAVAGSLEGCIPPPHSQCLIFQKEHLNPQFLQKESAEKAGKIARRVGRELIVS